jgi:hypothetical protein
MPEDREAANSAGWSPEEPISDEDHEYILWMVNHIQGELDDAFYDRNVNGDDSYLKELDERYGAGFLDTDLLGENPEWDEGDAGWDTRGMALKIAKDLFKRGKGLEWNTSN